MKCFQFQHHCLHGSSGAGLFILLSCSIALKRSACLVQRERLVSQNLLNLHPLHLALGSQLLHALPLLHLHGLVALGVGHLDAPAVLDVTGLLRSGGEGRQGPAGRPAAPPPTGQAEGDAGN